MKRKVVIRLIPVAVIVVLIVVNVIICTLFPLKGLRYVNNGSDEYSAVLFKDERSIIVFYEDFYEDIKTSTSEYTMSNGKIITTWGGQFEKHGYTLISESDLIYTCNDAVVLQVFITIGYATCLVFMFLPVMKKCVKKLRADKSRNSLKNAELENELSALRGGEQDENTQDK